MGFNAQVGGVFQCHIVVILFQDSTGNRSY
jgi:hypothetical protein